MVRRQRNIVEVGAQRAIDAGEAVVVGVNRFADERPAGAQAGVFRVDPEIERRQVARVRAVRAGRSEREWRSSIAAIDLAAREGGNLVPPIMAASNGLPTAVVCRHLIMAAARSAAGVTACGTKMTTTPPTPGSAMAASMVLI